MIFGEITVWILRHIKMEFCYFELQFNYMLLIGTVDNCHIKFIVLLKHEDNDINIKAFNNPNGTFYHDSEIFE